MISLLQFFASASCGGGTTSTGLVSSSNLPTTCANSGTVSNVLTILFVVLGALALLMMVIAGFRFVISAGKPDEVAAAKRQIIYSLAGLIVAALAVVIVQFVVNRVS
jgi:hypothetical protein